MTHIKEILDGLSIGVVLGTLVQILPPIASFLTIVWMAIRIYEYFKSGKTD